VTRARAEDYRRRAQECLDLARAISLERERAVLIDMAQNWPIDPKAVTLTRQDEKTWKATMNANKDQLRAAPEYKYESEWRKR
jgi:hypothetical protein